MFLFIDEPLQNKARTDLTIVLKFIYLFICFLNFKLQYYTLTYWYQAKTVNTFLGIDPNLFAVFHSNLQRFIKVDLSICESDDEDDIEQSHYGNLITLQFVSGEISR